MSRCEDVDVLFHLTMSELILVTHFSAVPRALMQIVLYWAAGRGWLLSPAAVGHLSSQPGDQGAGDTLANEGRRLITCLPLWIWGRGVDLSFKQAS